MALAEQYIRQAADILRRATQARSAELHQLNNDIESMRQEIHERQARARDEIANKKRTITLFEGEIQNAKRNLEGVIRREEQAIRQLDDASRKDHDRVRALNSASSANQQEELQRLNADLLRLDTQSKQHRQVMERATQEFGAYEAYRLQRISQLAQEISHTEQQTENVVRELQHRIDEKQRPLHDMDHQVRDLERKAIEVEEAAGEIPSTVFG